MKLSIASHVPLASFTTLNVGGVAEYFVAIDSEEALQEAVSFAERQQCAVHILGGGSNLLIKDEGVSGLVVHMKTKGIEFKEDGEAILITAEAGELWDDLVQYTVKNGWWGLENLSHIPGTVGATPVQNVGAYGVEVKDVIHSVRVYNMQTHAYETLDIAACSFGYRDSVFKHTAGEHYVVTAVTFALHTTPRPQLTYRDLQKYFADGVLPSLSDIREAVIAIRSQKFPDWHTVGTAGSFFKNPIIPNEQYESLIQIYPDLPGFVVSNDQVKISLGWVLDKLLHVRGYTEGTVGTYVGQALVLVADEGATADDVEQFAHNIIAKVKNKIGVDVEWEVTQM